MSRTLVVGDIHGANKALVQCLQRCNFDNSTDTLISLGDVADGWSEVPESVDTLLTIKNLIAIRGNHDVWCKQWFERGVSPDIWTQQGGSATCKAYVRTGKIADKQHREFWQNQVDYYIDDQGRLFIHAGWDLYDGFEQSCKYNIGYGTAAEVHWSRDLWDLPEDLSWAMVENTREQLEDYNEIFIGHTSHNDNNFNKHNIWNLDTGAGWSGVLTIMDVDTKEFWQSDNVQLLYKTERGRK